MTVKFAMLIGLFDAEVVSDAIDCLQDDEMASLYDLTRKKTKRAMY